MKLKYYLRGLGIGIIVTTVILAVSFSKKEIKMSDEEIMARAAQLGMVMQETETTEQGDTEQDPDGTDTGAKTEVVTEQTASELLEERTAAKGPRRIRKLQLRTWQLRRRRIARTRMRRRRHSRRLLVQRIRPAYTVW